MHRHGYRGRKFGRERDQRRALMRGLAIALIEHHSIKTTLPKAKDLRPKFEKLVTKARRGTLADRRAIISALDNIAAANKLVDVIAKAIKRDSGYLKIEKLNKNRVGDNAEMAVIKFVDEIPQTKPTARVKKPVAKIAPRAKAAGDNKGLAINVDKADNKEKGDK